MNNNEPNDALLVRQYMHGDEQALAKLIDKHQSKIYSFIFSKVRNRDLSEDIFQDTFIKVIHTLKKVSITKKVNLCRGWYALHTI